VGYSAYQYQALKNGKWRKRSCKSVQQMKPCDLCTSFYQTVIVCGENIEPFSRSGSARKAHQEINEIAKGFLVAPSFAEAMLCSIVEMLSVKSAISL
jgi:hypothetical protein